MICVGESWHCLLLPSDLSTWLGPSVQRPFVQALDNCRMTRPQRLLFCRLEIRCQLQTIPIEARSYVVRRTYPAAYSVAPRNAGNRFFETTPTQASIVSSVYLLQSVDISSIRLCLSNPSLPSTSDGAMADSTSKQISSTDRVIRAVTILNMIPGLGFFIPAGVTRRELWPLIGIVPLSLSACLGLLVLSVGPRPRLMVAFFDLILAGFALGIYIWGWTRERRSGMVGHLNQKSFWDHRADLVQIGGHAAFGILIVWYVFHLSADVSMVSLTPTQHHPRLLRPPRNPFP